MYQADLGAFGAGDAVGRIPETLVMLAEAWEMQRGELARLAPEIEQFAVRLIEAWFPRAEDIDAKIERLAEGWTVERMPVTDRNVLRLGAFEVLQSDTPDRVAIDEAVELAKRYGTAQSAQFVNGILDRLMHGEEDTPRLP